MAYNSWGTSVVVCTDLSGKEPYKQIGMGRVVTSGSLCGVMVSTLDQNDRDVGSIPTLGTIFPIFITPTTLLLHIPDEMAESVKFRPPRSSIRSRVKPMTNQIDTRHILAWRSAIIDYGKD